MQTPSLLGWGLAMADVSPKGPRSSWATLSYSYSTHQILEA